MYTISLISYYIQSGIKQVTLTIYVFPLNSRFLVHIIILNLYFVTMFFIVQTIDIWNGINSNQSINKADNFNRNCPFSYCPSKINFIPVYIKSFYSLLISFQFVSDFFIYCYILVLPNCPRGFYTISINEIWFNGATNWCLIALHKHCV